MRLSTTQWYQTALDAMLRQQSTLSKTQTQLASGQKITTPADDPAAAARLQSLDRALAQQSVYERNVGLVGERLRQTEAALDSVGEVMRRVRELSLQGANDTLSGVDRKTVAAELRERLGQLLALANSRAGNGDYLFAGGQVGTQPFVQSAGEVIYRGDGLQREISIGPGLTMADNAPGDQLFMRLLDGNGEARIMPAEGNLGSGYLVFEGPALTASYDGRPLQVIMVDARHVAILDEDGQPLPGLGEILEPGPPPRYAGVPVQAGQSITAAGVSFSLRGQPAAGDRWLIEPARAQSVFQTVARLAEALDRPAVAPAERAQQRQVLEDTLRQLDRIDDRVLLARATNGARQSTLDEVANNLSDQSLNLQQVISGLRDLDYAEVISRYQQQLAALQAAQQSFVQIQGLSLFRWLR